MNPSAQNEQYLLAGDIGGTKTSLAVYSTAGNAKEPLHTGTLPSNDYTNLETLAEAYLQQAGYDVSAACFGIAGPVVDGRVEVTNLPWIVVVHDLRSALGLDHLWLLNDLESIAYSIPILDRDDLHTLIDRKADDDGAIAVIAPGTGLGEGYLTYVDGAYRAFPSEGGHTDFGPVNNLQVELLTYLMETFEHVSYEHVCSGIGIPNIYNFLRDCSHAEEPEWLAQELAQAEDRTPIIVNTALHPDRSCEICKKTLDLFVSILGAEAGNLALKVLATSGVYLGGGIPPRIISALESDTFKQAFNNKGRFRDLTSKIPVHIILNPKVALIGAARYGLSQQRK
ncbi:MAG: glucokinase [Anaerolineales bacterium]|nr:glucokinase [Anaerolineales bacterium]